MEFVLAEAPVLPFVLAGRFSFPARGVIPDDFQLSQ
jgi:hypothetical protein